MDFFLIGAQKCATSWLFSCLEDHPGSSMPRQKREIHYLGGPQIRELGESWFFSQYDDIPGRARGTVSVNYMADTSALLAAAERFPEARFVVCLRQPLDRTLSAYNFYKRKGLAEGLDLYAALEHGLEAADGFQYQAPLEPSPSDLVARSMYARQLKPLIEAGHGHRLLVLCFESLCEKPDLALQSLYQFVGLDPAFVPESMGARPKRNANIPLLTWIEQLAPGSRPMGKIMDHANQWACRLGLGRPAVTLNGPIADKLGAIYAGDVEVLDGLLAQLPASQRGCSRSYADQWNLS